MRTILLITDLEGVAGVDELDCLIVGGPGHERARALLSDEAAAAARGLLRRADKVRLSDSHRSGASEPVVLAGALPPGVDLVRHEDAYADALWDGVDAVACLGMHAAAGEPGFAAHTVSIHCAWQAGGRGVSETDLVLALAAERGVPVIFVSGDDVLARATPGVTFVTTKTSLSMGAARSREAAAVRADLEQAAGAPARPAAALPPDVTLTFKSRWQAAVAARAGGERRGSHAVGARGESFRAVYSACLALVDAAAEPLGEAVRPHAFVEDAVELLRRPFPLGRPAPHRAQAEAALAAFLALTDGEASWQRADRALMLHMLEAHSQGFFAAAGLAATLDEAVGRLARVPTHFRAGLTPVEAMARLDALYVRHERGGAPRIDARSVRDAVARAYRDEPLFGWVLAEIARQLGIDVQAPPPARPTRVHDAYWLTHVFLLATRYLRRPLPAGSWHASVEALLLLVPWVLAGARVDIGAETAVCLQLAGEEETAEHHQLLALVGRHQAADGSVADPSTQGLPDRDEAARLRAHATGVSLLAFAGTLG